VTAYFSTGAAVGLAVAGSLVAGFAAMKARAVIAAVSRAHAELIGQ
jgi:hypothetical protein